MKKILALVLALMLVLSTSVVAFAADVNTSGQGNSTGDVDIEIEASDLEGDLNDVDADDATYLLDIDLEDYVFTYEFGDYNTGTHKYDDGEWDETEATITIKNHANTSLEVTAKFAGQTTATVSGVTATITKDTADIDSAVGTDPATATPQGTIEFEIDGVPTVVDGFQLTTVTLTIAGTDA